jgi:phosphonate transport system substrate-binding protein
MINGLSRRLFLITLILTVTGCPQSNPPTGKIGVGVVSFGESTRSVEQYAELKTYLGKELKSVIELEPTYNEIQARQQIERKVWDIVFAPPGLAAIAISESKYIPLFPLEGTLENRSVIIVLKDSPIRELSQLEGKIIALGQPGSATGYYLPIYNLYGLTLKEIRFATTPKAILELLDQQAVDASAMSLAEFNHYRSSFPNNRFQILFNDSHQVPNGAVLVSPNLDGQRQEQIRQALAEVAPAIAASAGYITNATPPQYDYLIEVVARVRQISERIKQKPAPLY